MASIALKKLINKQKRLWNSIKHRRYSSNAEYATMISEYKTDVKYKYKLELRNHEWKVATNCKLHPKMLHKYINEKVKITSVIRAVHNENSDIITDQETICNQFNE